MNKHEAEELQQIIQQRIDFLQVLVEENTATASEKTAKDSDNELVGLMAVPVEQHVIQQSQLEITDLKSAMQRLVEGKAGCCDECGGDIPFERLKTVPVTGFCVTCLEKTANSHR